MSQRGTQVLAQPLEYLRSRCKLARPPGERDAADILQRSEEGRGFNRTVENIGLRRHIDDALDCVGKDDRLDILRRKALSAQRLQHSCLELVDCLAKFDCEAA